MPKSKARRIILGPLPDGPLTDGRVILSPPRWSQWFRGRLATSWALIHAVRTNWPEVVAAFRRRDQSFNKRFKLVYAVVTVGATRNLYSEQGLDLMGLRHAICECTPGHVHRRPPAP